MQRAAGRLQELLQDGSRYLTGLEEAILGNIEKTKELAQITRTSLGPNGQNKMVINHLEKLFVTSDAATIMKELDIMHPAAKMIVMASHRQEDEVGDCTNFVITFAGELLVQAESLLRVGVHPSEIVAGYQKASLEAIRLMEEELVVSKIASVTDSAEVVKGIKTCLFSKMAGREVFMSELIAKACLSVVPKNPKMFNVDNVRVTKIVGSGAMSSSYIKGFVLARPSENSIKHVKNARVAVFTCPIDTGNMETKGTVLLNSAKELKEYSLGEEKVIEKLIKSLADKGINVLVCGSNIHELALHFMERHKIMALKCLSKFDLRRICRTIGATPLVRLDAPLEEEVGKCNSVEVTEVASTTITVFEQLDKDESKVATIVLRGSTRNILDELERAVDDGVNAFKQLTRDPQLLAGAGACDIELARRLSAFADQSPGLDQYAIRKFGEAFEVVPRILAENAGLDATEVIASLYAAHHNQPSMGVNIDGKELIDAAEREIYDHLASKVSAIRLATDAVVSVLRVNQIIMSKPAGGPKPPKQGPMDADD